MQDHVNYDMITLARETKGISVSELAGILGVAQGTMSKYENGTLPIPAELVEKLAEKLGFPKSFFFQTGRMYPVVMHWRKKNALNGKQLRSVIGRMNIFKQALETFAKDLELPDCKIPDQQVEGLDGVERAAMVLRQYWRVPEGPIHNLYNLLERNGIVIVEYDFGTNDLDGRSMVMDDGRPIIFVNSNAPMCRRRFTVAHELGHHILHFNPCLHGDEADPEKEANVFASEFLVPRNEIIRQFRQRKVTLATLAELKLLWKVSMAALIEKAKRLGVINADQTKYLYIQMNKNQMRRVEPPQLDPPIEKPRMLPEIIATFMDHLGYTKEELSGLVHLLDEDFDEMFLPHREKGRMKVVI